MSVAIWTDRRQNYSMGEKRKTRAAQVQEAWQILNWLLLGNGSELISAMVRRIEDRHERADARVDLRRIFDILISASEGSSRHAVWHPYQHHFVGDRNRKRFFAELRSLTRRIASACLVSIVEREGQRGGDLDESFRWNTSLLPRSIAPQVLRVAILHPGVLENFLPRFFVQASDFWAEKSTSRRAMEILLDVERFGWSAEKHTKMLVKLGLLDPSETGSEVERVKKFIRDLRRRHQKYLNDKARASA